MKEFELAELCRKLQAENEKKKAELERVKSLRDHYWAKCDELVKITRSLIKQLMLLVDMTDDAKKRLNALGYDWYSLCEEETENGKTNIL